MKIKALIPLWGREQVTRICFDGIKRLQKTVNIEPICIYSEDSLKSLCDEYGFESCYHENTPLGKKMNFGVDMAMRSSWDYLLNMGSDDLFDPELFEIYKPHMEASIPFFGVGCIYFYDINTRTAALHYGGQVFGCGRMIRRDMIDNSVYKVRFRYSQSRSGEGKSIGRGKEVVIPIAFAQRLIKRDIGVITEVIKEDFKLYPDEAMNGLDVKSEFIIETRRGIGAARIDIGKKPLVLDIKCGFNIHDIDEYDPVNFNVIEHFPDAIRGLI